MWASSSWYCSVCGWKSSFTSMFLFLCASSSYAPLALALLTVVTASLSSDCSLLPCGWSCSCCIALLVMQTEHFKLLLHEEEKKEKSPHTNYWNSYCEAILSYLPSSQNVSELHRVQHVTAIQT